MSNVTHHPSPITLRLRVASVGALGRHLPPREAGIDVPTNKALALGQAVTVELELLEPALQQVSLVGTVVQTLPAALFGAGSAVRVALDRRSWKRLFATVCHTPWRRRDDFDASSLELRHIVDIPGEALLPGRAPQDGELVTPVRVIEASARGVFLTLTDGDLTRGDALRFRTQRAMSWHRGEVRWTGSKGEQAGVGVLLSFSHMREQLAWTALVAEHERLAAAA